MLAYLTTLFKNWLCGVGQTGAIKTFNVMIFYTSKIRASVFFFVCFLTGLFPFTFTHRLVRESYLSLKEESSSQGKQN